MGIMQPPSRASSLTLGAVCRRTASAFTLVALVLVAIQNPTAGQLRLIRVLGCDFAGRTHA